MKFLARCSNATFIIRATVRSFDPISQVPIYHPGLTAKFRRHEFDSEAAQREYGWTDEERRHVENGLMANKDFGRSVYLADDKSVGKTSKSAPIRCVVFIPDGEGGSVQCSDDAVDGTNFCRTHFENAEVAV